MITMLEAREIAHAAADAVGVADSGVVISVRHNECGIAYDIWAIGVDGKIVSHLLWADCTSRARLEAHARGFVENHRAAWAAAA